MQDPKHIKSKCPKCHAERFQPCITNDGRVADKVHYGRPYWSDQVNDGSDFKANIPPIRQHPWPILFPGTDICADCGESYRQPGLVQRCQKRHNEMIAEMNPWSTR
jgi:hypothetical protein